MAQDLAAPLVVPVVQDAGEDVDVAVRRYVSEVARPVGAAPAEAGGVERAARRFEDVRAFEQDAVEARVGGEDAAEQGPVSARDVDDGPPAGCLARGRDDGVLGERLEHA